MSILTVTIIILGGMTTIYLGTNIVATITVALLTLSIAAIAGIIGYKLFSNLRNGCDLFSMKKCSK